MCSVWALYNDINIAENILHFAFFLSCIKLSGCNPPVMNKSIQICHLLLLSNGKLPASSWNSCLPQMHYLRSGYCTSSPLYFPGPQIYLLVWCSLSLYWKTASRRWNLEHIPKLSSLEGSACLGANVQEDSTLLRQTGEITWLLNLSVGLILCSMFETSYWSCHTKRRMKKSYSGLGSGFEGLHSTNTGSAVCILSFPIVSYGPDVYATDTKHALCLQGGGTGKLCPLEEKVLIYV